MTFDFNFRTPDSFTDIRQLTDFLTRQHLGYPDYDAWVQRAEAELDAGYKHAVLAFSDGRLVGDVIHQPHKDIPGFCEVKNIRIHQDVRRRDFGHFMLKQAEADTRGQFDAFWCDARATQQEVLSLLAFTGYNPIATTSLYDPHTNDVVMLKPVNPEKSAGLVNIAKNSLLSH